MTFENLKAKNYTVQYNLSSKIDSKVDKIAAAIENNEIYCVKIYNNLIIYIAPELFIKLL